MSVTSADGRRAHLDVIGLGEVMLRLDPGESRIRSARSFDVWEGGGEYNAVRALGRTFGLRTAFVTALVDNEIGRLVESLMLAGGVDVGQIRWAESDGVGRSVRNGLNFVERGFGIRGGPRAFRTVVTPLPLRSNPAISTGQGFSATPGPVGYTREAFSPGSQKAVHPRPFMPSTWHGSVA